MAKFLNPFDTTATSGSARTDEGGMELMSRITSTMQTFSQNITEITSMCAKLGTPEDTKTLRRRIQEVRNACQIAIRKIKGELQIPPEPEKQSQHAKITAQFQDLCLQYEKQSKLSLQKERELVVMMESSMSTKGTSPIGLEAQNARFAQELEAIGLKEIDLKIIEETNEEVRQIERDLEELRDVFKDVAVIVEEQKENLTVIETKLEEAEMNVEEGVDQLVQANELAKSYRKKFIFIGICIAITILVIALAVKLH